jgi:hypothetical protein
MCNTRSQGRPLSDFPILSLDSHFFDDRRRIVLGENPELELRPSGTARALCISAGAVTFVAKIAR